MLSDLDAKENRFLAENGLLEEQKAEDTNLDAAPSFRKRDLDSVLWVTQHGMPTHWQPLVHDLEDEFFPEVGVLR